MTRDVGVSQHVSTGKTPGAAEAAPNFHVEVKSYFLAPVILSIHRRWWNLAQVGVTSPRMTELNPPRTIAVPMYTWMMKPANVTRNAIGCRMIDASRRNRRLHGMS